MSRVQIITCDYRFVFGTCARSTTAEGAVGWRLGETADYCPLHAPKPDPRAPHPVPIIARRRAA